VYKHILPDCCTLYKVHVIALAFCVQTRSWTWTKNIFLSHSVSLTFWNRISIRYIHVLIYTVRHNTHNMVVLYRGQYLLLLPSCWDRLWSLSLLEVFEELYLIDLFYFFLSLYWWLLITNITIFIRNPVYILHIFLVFSSLIYHFTKVYINRFRACHWNSKTVITRIIDRFLCLFRLYC
jgi:hypothetical protein